MKSKALFYGLPKGFSKLFLAAAFILTAFTANAKYTNLKTNEKHSLGMLTYTLSPTNHAITFINGTPSKEEIIITPTDGIKRHLTEQKANQKGMIHNHDHENFKQVIQIIIKGNSTEVRGADTVKPVYVLEGAEISETEISKINPKDIESINVLKATAATNKYGVKGRNGVVENFLKKSSFNQLQECLNDEAAFWKWVGIVEFIEIQSYSLAKREGDDEVDKLDIKGAGLTPNTKKFLTKLQPGDVLVIHKILVKQNGALKKLPAVVKKL